MRYGDRRDAHPCLPVAMTKRLVPHAFKRSVFDIESNGQWKASGELILIRTQSVRSAGGGMGFLCRALIFPNGSAPLGNS